MKKFEPNITKNAIEDYFNQTETSSVQEGLELCKGIASLPDILKVIEAARKFTDTFESWVQDFEPEDKASFFQLQFEIEELDEKHGEEVI